MAGLLYELQVKLGLDTKDFDQGITNAKKEGSTFGDVLKGSLASAAIQKGISTLTSGVKSAAGAFKNITVAAVNSYKDYEQLTGGVETLFEKSSGKVKKYADDAYKTAGMSANEYMSTVTSFSASLISSLDNDTSKAADYADRAIKDMSDNANKMGTDISSIQNAYQGFAKQNYTMLDNLKLGYGGTQEEAKRLVKEASNMKKEMKELGVEVKEDDLSFSNLVDAISVVQKHMNITGTTTKEAMTTIEGSANATKAAWQNVLTAIAGGGDLKNAMNQLQEAVFGGKKGEGLLNQLIPRIKTVFEGIAEFVGKAAPIIKEKLPKLLDELKPALESLVKSIGTILKTLIPILVPVFIEVGKTFVTGIIQGLGDLGAVGTAIENAIAAIVAIKFIKGAANLVTSLKTVGEALSGLVGNLKNFSSAGLSRLTEFASSGVSKLTTFARSGASAIQSFMSSGISIVSTGISKLSGVLSTGISALSSFVTNGVQLVSNGISSFATMIASNPMIVVIGLIVAAVVAAVVLIVKNWDTIKKAASDMWKNVKNTFSSFQKGVTDFAKKAAEGVKKWWGDMSTAVGNKASEIKSNAQAKFKDLKQNVGEAVRTLGNNVKTTFETLKTNLATIINDIKTNAQEKWNSLKETAVNVWGGIKESMTSPINAAKNGINTAINVIKGVFDGLRSFAQSIGSAMKKIGDAIVAPIRAASQVVQSILNSIKGFFNSIKTVAKSIGDTLSGAVSTVGTLTTSTATHADAMGEGVILNRLTTIGYANGTIHKAGEAGEEAVIGTKSLSNLIKNSVRNGMRGTGGGVTINVYGAQGQNINDLADAVAERFQTIVEQKAAVWA